MEMHLNFFEYDFRMCNTKTCLFNLRDVIPLKNLLKIFN